MQLTFSFTGVTTATTAHYKAPENTDSFVQSFAQIFIVVYNNNATPIDVVAVVGGGSVCPWRVFGNYDDDYYCCCFF